MTSFLRAKYLLPLSDELGRDRRIEDGYVLWRDETILAAGAFDPRIAREIVEQYGPELVVCGSGASRPGVTDVEELVLLEGVLLPGFVKTHGHDHEPPIIGLVKDVPLTKWLDGVVNPFTGFISEHREELLDEIGRSPQSVAYSKARLDDLHYGITTSMVHHCNHSKYFASELAAEAEAAGTTMIIAVGSQDRHYAEALLDTPEQAITRLDQYHERHRDSSIVQIVPGPDQLFSNGPEMLLAQKQWARERGLLFHCHSSEEKGTTAWFRERYGKTPVEYADELGILDESTILAHQVHTTERDLEILADRGTRVVHNPLANTILGSGMPPLLAMLERGIPVAISTDGSGSADNQNILAAARLASQYQKAAHSSAEVLPAQQVLEMITVDAARMLRMNAGSLAAGKRADIILLATDTPNMTPTRCTNVVENLIWASDGSEVRMVVARGRVVREGAIFHTLDRAKILADVSYLAEAFDRHRPEAPTISGTGANIV